MLFYYLVLSVCRVAFAMTMSGKSLFVLADQMNACFTYDFSFFMFPFYIIMFFIFSASFFYIYLELTGISE